MDANKWNPDLRSRTFTLRPETQCRRMAWLASHGDLPTCRSAKTKRVHM